MTDRTEKLVDELGEAIDRCNEERARLRNELANLTGAAAGMLHAIEKAGGWVVFDPGHHDMMAHAIRSLAASVDFTLATRRELGGESVYPISMLDEIAAEVAA